MKVTKPHAYTTIIESPVSRSGDVVSFLLLSDLHWDNPHCDRALLKRHLEEAKAKGAGIMIFGDLFCAMQGKYDPRGNKASIRPEHNVANYLDALVDSVIEYFKPYAENICLITPGNHETSILRRLETDITARLCAGLGVQMGTYAGWVIVRLSRSEKSYISKVISYHHGYGGGGAVTKDIIQASRKAVYLPDADIIVSGHTHDRWIFPIQRVRLNNAGRQHLEEQLHLKLGTYKDEYTEAGGWAVEKGMPPKSSGGIWLEFIYERNPDGVRVRAELA